LCDEQSNFAILGCGINNMQKSNKQSLILAATLILGVGVLIGLNINSKLSADGSSSNNSSSNDSSSNDSSSNDSSSNNEASESDVAAFQQLTTVVNSNEYLYQDIIKKLTTESNARKELEKNVQELNLQMSKLDNELQNSNLTQHSISATPSQNSTQWFNEEAMVDTGLSAPEIAQIKDRYESIEMEKLYLRDQAIRENWIGTQRYLDELNAVDNQFQSLRNDMDDTAYETLLFATGQPNRVVVQNVMQNSPASLAGIKAGDQIIQYSNERIYSASDLRKSTTSGEIDQEVNVDLSRDGNKMTVYLPRGPLGIRMESASIKP